MRGWTAAAAAAHRSSSSSSSSSDGTTANRTGWLVMKLARCDPMGILARVFCK